MATSAVHGTLSAYVGDNTKVGQTAGKTVGSLTVKSEFAGTVKSTVYGLAGGIGAVGANVATTMIDTLVQSYILDGLLKKHGSAVSQVVEIEVPTLELIRRLNARSHTDDCMPYDNSTEKIVKRLQEHENKTVPVIEKYNQLHGVAKVDGMGTFEEVFARTSVVIENGFKNMR